MRRIQRRFLLAFTISLVLLFVSNTVEIIPRSFKPAITFLALCVGVSASYDISRTARIGRRDIIDLLDLSIVIAVVGIVGFAYFSEGGGQDAGLSFLSNRAILETLFGSAFWASMLTLAGFYLSMVFTRRERERALVSRFRRKPSRIRSIRRKLRSVRRKIVEAI